MAALANGQRSAKVQLRAAYEARITAIRLQQQAARQRHGEEIDAARAAYQRTTEGLNQLRQAELGAANGDWTRPTAIASAPCCARLRPSTRTPPATPGRNRTASAPANSATTNNWPAAAPARAGSP